MLKQDLITRNQSILRHKEQETRQKREIPVPQGVGNVSIGSVYDCNRKHFERVLKAYWGKLYVGWNPFKNEGNGCWEVWQEPTKKTPVLRYHNRITEEKIYTLEYRPNDFEHWVADLKYLSYAFIAKLKRMDAWENKSLVEDHDRQHGEYQQKQDELEEEHLRNVVKDNRKVFRDLLDYTQSGYNPLDFFRGSK